MRVADVAAADDLGPAQVPAGVFAAGVLEQHVALTIAVEIADGFERPGPAGIADVAAADDLGVVHQPRGVGPIIGLEDDVRMVVAVSRSPRKPAKA